MQTRRNFVKKTALAASAALCVKSTALAKESDAAKSGGSISLQKQIPVSYVADVAVLGGGIAGVAAACAAAKSGASVILAERFAITGGMLTSGGVANFCGKTEGQGEVFDEILNELRRFNSLGEGRLKNVFNHGILSIILQEMLLKRGVKLMLHTRFVDVNMKGREIAECVVCGKSGLEAIRAKVFIDTTGDADVARYANFATMKGDDKEGLQLPMSQMFFVREVDENEFVLQVPANFHNVIKDKKDLPMVSPWPDGPRGKAVKVKIPMFDSTSTASLTAAEIKARQRIMEVLYYFQTQGKRKWRYTNCAEIIGIREGCRIVGDYVLKVDDLRQGRAFEDAVACGSFILDGHSPKDDKRTYILPEKELKVPPYHIPMRALIAKDGDNLLMAGRCLSADQLALSSARVSTSAAMTGQAVGIAAALAAAKNVKVRDLNYADIRAEVEKRGADLDIS